MTYILSTHQLINSLNELPIYEIKSLVDIVSSVYIYTEKRSQIRNSDQNDSNLLLDYI